MAHKNDIWKIADRLIAEGRPVSVRLVRDERGGGSLRDISAHLSTWRAAQVRATATCEADDLIPKAEHERLLKDVEDRLEGERRRLLMETDAIRQGIAAPHILRNQSLEKRVQELERELLIAEHDLNSLRRRLAELEPNANP